MFKPFKCLFALIILATYWTAEVTPLAVTSLVPMFLFPTLGLLPAARTAQHYFKVRTAGRCCLSLSLYNDHSTRLRTPIFFSSVVSLSPLRSRSAIYTYALRWRSWKQLVQRWRVTFRSLTPPGARVPNGGLLTYIFFFKLKDLFRFKKSEVKIAK